jgi:hypothetical protein
VLRYTYSKEEVLYMQIEKELVNFITGDDMGSYLTIITKEEE